MRERLTELGETVMGAAWWGFANVWGLVMGAMLVLAPLILAALIVTIVDLPPAPALLAGTLLAAAFGLPPWTGDDRREVVLALAGVAGSWAGWQLLREPDATIATLMGMLLLGAAAWLVRRVLALRGRPGNRADAPLRGAD